MAFTTAATSMSQTHESHAQILTACRLIEASNPAPDLATLAMAAGLSPAHFHRRFKALLGITPHSYAELVRAARLRNVLPRSASVTDALFDAGFNAPSSFYERIKDVLGMSPERYRKGGVGETIRFALGQCSLGALLVAATDKGICEIALGDQPESLLEALQARFPHAELIGADAQFEQWMARVVAFVDTPGQDIGLPLDVRGTAFQQRVWQALREIPVGTTTSYSELASKLGVPRAVRAVASACAANKLAVAIPCHRVVRNDGSLSGYRWGLARKQALITREHEHST